jgi:hypothetical protein
MQHRRLNNQHEKKLFIIGAKGSIAQYVIESIKELYDTELSLFVPNKKKAVSHPVKRLQYY